MKKTTFLIAGKHAVTEALKNPKRKVINLFLNLERVKGIEPSRPAWKAGVLPLNYTRTQSKQNTHFCLIKKILKRKKNG